MSNDKIKKNIIIQNVQKKTKLQLKEWGSN